MKLNLFPHYGRLQHLTVYGVIDNIKNSHAQCRIRRRGSIGNENRRDSGNHRSDNRNGFCQQSDKAKDQRIRNTQNQQYNGHGQRRKHTHDPQAFHIAADGHADPGQYTADLGTGIRREQVRNHRAELPPVFQEIKSQERHYDQSYQICYHLHRRIQQIPCHISQKTHDSIDGVF